jgi:hypothetical protein
MTNDAIGLFYRKIYHLMKLNKLEMKNRYELRDIDSEIIGERILYTNKSHHLTITWYYGCDLTVFVFNSNNASLGQFEVIYNISSDTNSYSESISDEIKHEDLIFVNKIHNAFEDVQKLYYMGAFAPV